MENRRKGRPGDRVSQDLRMTHRKTRTTVFLDEPVRKRLFMEKTLHGTTMATIINAAVMEWFDRKYRRDSDEAA